VEREAGAAHTGKLRESVLELAIQNWKAFRRVTRQCWVDADNQTRLRLKAELLAFEMREAFGEQPCAHQRHCGLQSHENFLRKG
jgi:hypothetical protein